MKNSSRNRLSAAQYVNEILRGNRVVLAQAITLIESKNPGDRALADQVIEHILPHTGRSMRLGITGSPGVGKSTFIEAFGKYLTDQDKKIAVLAIDPSSSRTKGSILGDKTRMEELSKDTRAFIRPTAAGSALGGVADYTREAILLCEAAGYEIIIVETVGVGQSEIAVRNMVDFFLLLMLAGSGDELQGIKKGIMEMADGIVITKADGDNLHRARLAQADFQHALHLFPPSESGWQVKVLTASALERTGLQQIEELLTRFREKTEASGFFMHQRQQQNLEWFRTGFHNLITHHLFGAENLKQKISALESQIQSQQISPGTAARQLFHEFTNPSTNQHDRQT